ncbi:MAG: hypothetical protein Q4F21_14370 [Lachnospiraceae bacterium]|nr:hypothetical protein [Lachnospiraceae bacterium]
MNLIALDLYDGAPMDNIGYIVVDLDNNGTKELATGNSTFLPSFFLLKNEKSEGVLKSPILRTRRYLGGIAVSDFIYSNPPNDLRSKKAMKEINLRERNYC